MAQVRETLFQTILNQLRADPLHVVVCFQFTTVVGVNFDWPDPEGATSLKPDCFDLLKKFTVSLIATHLLQKADIQDALSAFAAKTSCVMPGDHQAVACLLSLDHLPER